MAGLIKPTPGLPLAAACWLARAVNPAHRGAEALVPPVMACSPLLATIQITASARQATSGTLRMAVDPPLPVISTPCCQLGMG